MSLFNVAAVPAVFFILSILILLLNYSVAAVPNVRGCPTGHGCTAENKNHNTDLSPGSVFSKEILNQADIYGGNDIKYSRPDAEKAAQNFSSLIPGLTPTQKYWETVVDSGEAVWKYVSKNAVLLLGISVAIIVVILALVVVLIFKMCCCVKSRKSTTLIIDSSRNHHCKYEIIKMDPENRKKPDEQKSGQDSNNDADKDKIFKMPIK